MSGFTLVELLVVLAISATLIALVPMSYQRLRDGVAYRDTLRMLLAELRSARETSRSEGRPIRFQLDLSARAFAIEGKASYVVPQPLQLQATVGRDLVSSTQVAEIVFLPGGGATGGSFDVIRPSGDGTRVRVDWLTGRVEWEPLRP